MQALGSIERDLAGSAPALASMLGIFSRLTSGEEMPADEKIRIPPGRPPAYRPGRARRHPRRGIASPQPPRLYARLGWQQTVLLLSAIISAGLLAVALVLNNGGDKACIRSTGTACPSSPSVLRAFPHGRPVNYAIDPLNLQTEMIDNTGRRVNGGSASPGSAAPRSG
jgi:hypothetical protein